MIKNLLLLFTVFASFSANAQTSRPVYLDPKAPLEERVKDALSRMTTREKVRIL